MSRRHVAFLPLSPRAAPRGVAVVMVVACLATFSLIALAMLRGSLIARGQFRSEHHLRQAELLLDAAEDRARMRLARGEATAAGELAETIEIAAEEVTGSAAGRIRIEATEVAEGWEVRIEAEYPLDGSRAVRRSRELLLAPSAIPPPENAVPNELSSEDASPERAATPSGESADAPSEQEDTQPPEETLP